MSKNTPEIIIQHTKKWLSTVVIDYGLCPFVKREFMNEKIHYEIINEKKIAEQLEVFIMQCVYLDNNPDIETSLLIFPASVEAFEDYLDLYYIADEMLEKQGYSGIYQLASFHPGYCFADTNIKSNFLCCLGYGDHTKIFQRLPRLDFDEVCKII